MNKLQGYLPVYRVRKIGEEEWLEVYPNSTNIHIINNPEKYDYEVEEVDQPLNEIK